ncbi:receptor-type tyrosine-protein phosphatase epsilon-like [Anneissia japonica]|uniref:receptor-type tyrosine-protein phosphatase epsilon-like n=1 Tax=Anneissia japonica TaxID=1529436 RepID=UPI00142578B0|nr:receptor-type tyrosine-protein phosphatase epsilon-like [Anneissia japonica]
MHIMKGENDDPQKLQCNNILRYELQCQSNDDSNWTMYTTDSSMTYYTIVDLVACKEYRCRVRIVNDAGLCGPWSEYVTTRTTPTEPKKIASVSIVMIGVTEISLTWEETENGNCPVTYNVTYKPIIYDMCDETNDGVIKEGPIQITSYTISDLTAYSKYEIMVQPSSEDVVGPPSDKQTIQTNEDVPTGPPTSLQILSIGFDSVSISWDQPICGERKGVVIYDYKLFVDRMEIEDKTNFTDTSKTFADLLQCTFYTFEITAKTSKGNGPYATVNIATSEKAPDPVENIEVDGVSYEQINVTWDIVENGNCSVVYGVSYRLTNRDQCEPFNYTEFKSALNATTKPFCSLSSLEPYSTYEILILPSTGDFTGNDSVKQETTKIAAPDSAPQIDNVSDQKPRSLTLSWSDIPCGQRNGDTVYQYSLSGPDNLLIQQNTKSITVTIDHSIEPCNNYTFEVYGRNYNLNGPISSLNLTSGTEEPGEPKIISVASEKESVTVNWNAPTDNDCPILMYTVTLKSKDKVVKKKNASGSDREIRFTSGDGVKPNTEYTVQIVAANSAGVGEANKASTETSVRAGLISGLTIPFGILIIILIISFVLLQRRRSGKEAKNVTGEDTFSNTASDSNELRNISPKTTPKQNLKRKPITYQPVRMNKLHEYVRKRCSHKTENFQTEFEELGCSILHPCTEAKKYINRTKNRYANILTYDHSRVVLVDSSDQSDYINASYIKYNDNTYIASQGPNGASVNDMWRMVWQEKTGIIIMVTNLVEKRKIKCEQYWPNANEGLAYGDITVQNVGEETNRYFTIRTFQILMGAGEEAEIRHVLQYHFTAWPDMDVPASPAPLLEFVYRIKNSKKILSADTGPIIVHCSAGVGRTGTVITIDVMLDMAKEKREIDVFNFVKVMRNNRFNMVQTKDQYIFIYEAILECFFCEPTHIPSESFTESFTKIKGMKSQMGKTIMQEQLNTLNALVPLPTPDKTKAANDPANSGKNRYPRIVPMDNARPLLMTTDGDRNNYINASFCKGYGQRGDKYLVTQAPMTNTVSDFWRMIYDYRLYTIVMLNVEDADDKTIGMYIPLDLKVEVRMGPFAIEVESVKECNYVIKRTLLLSKDNEKPREIHHFQYLDWPKDLQKPPSMESFFQLRSDVEKAQRINPDSIMVIHCLDGRSRSGSFCAMDMIIQMINEESIIDVFQNVKKIKISCPWMFKSKDQYELCYEMAQSYLDSFNIYGNFK